MRIWTLGIFVISLIVEPQPVVADATRKNEPAAPRPGTPPSGSTELSPMQSAAAVLARMLRDNSRFVETHGPRHFEPFLKDQHPRATVVACADSRFHIQALDSQPDGEVFEIRNIGNQVDSSEGSVEYAIYHLHTPLLMVLGHVACGAVRAAMGDYGDEPPSIRRELDGLHLSLRRAKASGTLEQQWLTNVQSNVHQQVSDALHEYREEITKGRLVVVGAVYDFRGDLGKGRGRLHIINVNGETAANKLSDSPLLREVRKLMPGAP